MESIAYAQGQVSSTWISWIGGLPAYSLSSYLQAGSG
jgi:hypothetical protein